MKAEHPIAYRDRLVAIDSEMTHYQKIEADGSNRIQVGFRETNIRFSPLSVNLIRTLSTIYQKDVDYVVIENSSGNNYIEWKIQTPPTAGTLLAVHYQYHPVWIVQQHIHTYRDTEVKDKQPSATHTKMPIQAMIKLAFLTDEED